MTSNADTGPHRREPTGSRIVVGVDGSSSSMLALSWAAAEAQLRGSSLEVIHADWARREALEALAPAISSFEESVLDRALTNARALAPNLAVTGRICDPPAAAALLEASKGADMLVVGATGLTGLTSGSVRTECARHARCPVVVIRPAPSEPARTAQPGPASTSAASRRQHHTTG